jgi:bleomycin hydrolase
MHKGFLFVGLLCGSFHAMAQGPVPAMLPGFRTLSIVKATPVKNQGMTGTCWCFSATSLVESQALAKTGHEFDLSEAFTVRSIYLEKAQNYILRQGKAQFSEGGLGHDMVRAVALYGAVPEVAYRDIPDGQKAMDHQKLFSTLEHFVDSVVKKGSISANWQMAYEGLLNQYLGIAPREFPYNGKTYTPQSFAHDVLKFDVTEYVNLTSFIHQPYYKPFVVQVPDNYSNGSYYNLPLTEFTELVKAATAKGYSVVWDADVSNNGFQQGVGLALNLEAGMKYKKEELSADMTEAPSDSITRQKLYENLVTQDDHLMHIIGVEKSAGGKDFFRVKNSWGEVGPYKGYILVSEAYFKVNTITLVVPKAALSKELIQKLKL